MKSNVKIAQNVSDLVGNTPLLNLQNIEKHFNLNCKIFAKLEYLNPAGSSKDRIVSHIVQTGLKNGTITKDSVIIEPTSGNTGIGLAAICASFGIKVILTMPETMSEERRALLKIYGAEIVLTAGEEGMEGAVKKAEFLAKSIPNAMILGQFDNPLNPEIHYLTTGPEIWQDTKGCIDAFVAGVGTGGTVSGTAKYLKEKNPKIFIIAYEPASSPLLTKGKASLHKIQGIGANFVPKNFNRSCVDKILTITDEAALEMTNLIVQKEGVFVGISSGGALAATVDFVKNENFIGKNVVVLFPDSGDRYISVLKR
ncbi:MAG: cysteine synthase A [Treponema sp.]|jgi:cysteine synthase A|nr:cysteine synthase A [Treponema sp.]